MKHRLYGFATVAAVLAALVLNVPATAGEDVPFKARLAGIITNLGFDPVRNVVYLHQVGKGQATHLGSFTVDATREIDLTGGPGRSTWVCTAANGDMLLLVGVGGGGTGPNTAAGTLRIVGGTGRFEGATGLLQLAITFAIAPPTSDPNPYTAVLEGTISLNQ
ncbi:MAG: hypothetical protein HYZ57_15195 [Acidobacteria bacterium]|nr:hypothetical protein [Acidobacteriota bacterium]